jgi:hypothetical protein
MKTGAGLFALLTAVSVGATASGNRVHDRLVRLPEPKRNEVLTEFMTDSGESCEVKHSFFQGSDEQRAAYWNVACSNRKAYAIALNEDGSSKVTECKRLKAVSNIDCFKPIDAP